MSTGNFKKSIFKQLARIGKALSSANRLELLEFIAQGERSVEALAKVSGLSVANASQHLRQLRQAGLLNARKEGQYVYYRLADEAVVDLLGLLRGIAEGNLAEVEQLIRTYLVQKDDLEPVVCEDLLQRAREEMVTVLDVRPPEEFDAGHLPNALNIPLQDLEKRLEELPADQEVVAYCRGPYCVLAFEAVSKLRENGYRARRLKNGYPEWKRGGLPVEISI